MEEIKKTRVERFVDFVFEKKQKDVKFRAAFRNAINPNLSFQSWEYLTSFCNLNNNNDFLAFSLVGALIAKSDSTKNGSLTLGKAIYLTYKTFSEESGKTNLRKILGSHSFETFFRNLKPILNFVNSNNIKLDYCKLLYCLLNFEKKIENTKRRIASDYYTQGE